MCGEENDHHCRGEGEVCRVGAAAAAQEITGGADAQHAEGGGGERSAEETHGAGGEIGDVAEGEVVGFGASGHGEEGDDVGAWGWVGGGEGEVAADDGDKRGEGDEGVEVPGEDAAVCDRILDA